MRYVLALVVAVVLIGGGAWLLSRQVTPPTTEGPGGATSMPTEMTLAGGRVAIAYPDDFGLAVTPAQVSVTSYIPPCEPGFDYCLYYNEDAYEGTNFDSAGLRIDHRTDLATELSCINTPPAGYTGNTTPVATSSDSFYSTSVFSVGDAGAGHYANGSLYRLYITAFRSCYEFETRIGESQFANYPAGTVRQFTDANRASVSALLRRVIDSVTLVPTGTLVIFPKLP